MNINTYISVQKEWNAGWGFNNSLTLTFTNGGVAFNISAYTFAIGIRRIGGGANVLSLTQGAGITNGGASGVLTVQITKAQTELIDADSYFYTINYTVSSLLYSLLHGTFNLLDDYNPDDINNSISIPVTLGGTNLDVAITLASGQDTRVRSTTSTATLTPNVSLYDMDVITAQTEALVIANPAGTPSDGNGYVIRVTDNGTARAISFGNKFRAFGNGLPTTTQVNKTMYIVFIYNSADDKYDVMNYIEEA